MYKTHRNKTEHLKKKAEKEYYTNLLEASKSNSKKTWSILKTVINKKRNTRVQTQFKINDSIVTDKNHIAEKFNDFFVNIGPNLANKIPTQTKTPNEYLGNKVNASIFISNVEQKEFGEILGSLKSCAAGYDGIGKEILSLCLPYIGSSLLHVINLSLNQGVFPSELK